MTGKVLAVAARGKPGRLKSYRVTLRRVEQVTVEIDAYSSVRAREGALRMADLGQAPATASEWVVEDVSGEDRDAE